MSRVPENRTLGPDLARSHPERCLRQTSKAKSRRDIVNDSVRQVEELAREWASAELRGDAPFLGGVLADDFVGVGPRGFTLTKEQWLARHEVGNLRYESFGLEEVEVRPYGEAAVAVCRQSADGVYEDENGRYDINEQFRATLVFVKQRERWLLAGLQLSPILGRP
jgi:ketosteroid isomerase-like protein